MWGSDVSAYAVEITAEKTHQAIEQGVDYLVEGERGFNVFELIQHNSEAWAPVKGEINFGYVPSVHWFRVSLESGSAQPIDRLLEISYPLLDHVSIYFFTGESLTNSFATGDALPFARRPIEHRHFLFPC